MNPDICSQTLLPQDSEGAGEQAGGGGEDRERKHYSPSSCEAVVGDGFTKHQLPLLIGKHPAIVLSFAGCADTPGTCPQSVLRLSVSLSVSSSLRLFVSSSLRLFVSSSLRLFVSSSLRLFVSSSLRLFVSSSLRLFVSSSLRLLVS